MSRLEPQQLTRLLLWTPWDRRTKEDLPKELLFGLVALEDEFFSECFVRPTGELYERFKGSLYRSTNSAIVVMGHSGVGKSTLVRAGLHELQLYNEAVFFDMLDASDVTDMKKISRCLNSLTHNHKLVKKIIELILIKMCGLLNVLQWPKPQNDTDKHLRRIMANYEMFFKHPGTPLWEIMLVVNKFLADGIYTCQDESTPGYYEAMRETLFNEFFTEGGRENPLEIVDKMLAAHSDLVICSMDKPAENKSVIVFDNIEHFLDNMVIYDDEIRKFLGMIYNKTEEGFIHRQNNRYSGLPGKGRDPLTTSAKPTSTMYSERLSVVIAVRVFSRLMQEIPVSKPADEVDAFENRYEFIKLDEQFGISEIITKKFEFIAKHANRLSIHDYADIRMEKQGEQGHVVVSDDILYKFLIRFFEDEKVLKIGLSHLFSHSKRRIVHNVVHACLHDTPENVKPHPAYRVREDIINNYLYLIQKRRYIDYEIRKDGARNLIYRMLMDSATSMHRPHSVTRFERKNFFKYLEMDKADNVSLARRTLQFLSRHRLNNGGTNSNIDLTDNRIIKLSELMEALFIPPEKYKENRASNLLLEYASNNPGDIGKLANLLYIMHDRDMGYHWAPLVLLIFKQEGNIDTDKIYSKLLEICKNPSAEVLEGDLQYGIKCTCSGRSLVERLSDFEFMAAVLNPYSRELFSETYVSDQEACIAHLNIVMDNVFVFIDAVFEHTKKFVRKRQGNNWLYRYNSIYSSVNDCRYIHNPILADNVTILYRRFDNNEKKHVGRELTHPDRIIVEHIRYIDSFRIYIIHENIGGTSSQERRESTKNFSLALLSIIEEYIIKLEKLTRQKCGRPGSEEYYIGGKLRSECASYGYRIDWAKSNFGYAALLSSLRKAKEEPLDTKIRITTN